MSELKLGSLVRIKAYLLDSDDYYIRLFDRLSYRILDVSDSLRMFALQPRFSIYQESPWWFYAHELELVEDEKEMPELQKEQGPSADVLTLLKIYNAGPTDTWTLDDEAESASIESCLDLLGWELVEHKTYTVKRKK